MSAHPSTTSDGPVSTSAAAAVEKLVAAEGGRLLHLARRFCGTEAEAEDLVQDVFLQALRKWHTFDGRSRPATWLYTIAARACRRRKRGRAGSSRKPVSLDALLPFGEARIGVVPRDEGISPAERRELGAQVDAAIAALPVAFRMPFVLRDVVGFKPSEIASILGLAEPTVRSRVHRARLLVRAGLAQALPRAVVAPPVGSREVCLDLLAAKQSALDRGVAFRLPAGESCQRCAEIFATLDLARDLCRSTGPLVLPARVAREIRRRARAVVKPRERRKP